MHLNICSWALRSQLYYIFEIPLLLNTLTVHVLKIQDFFWEEEREKKGFKYWKKKYALMFVKEQYKSGMSF